MKRETTFTRGKIMQPLILFALPVLLALLLQAMYGAVDLLVVGKFAEAADVSAVSTGSQITLTLANLVSSFAMGTTILLGQQIGKREPFGDVQNRRHGDRSVYAGDGAGSGASGGVRAMDVPPDEYAAGGV